MYDILIAMTFLALVIAPALVAMNRYEHGKHHR